MSTASASPRLDELFATYEHEVIRIASMGSPPLPFPPELQSLRETIIRSARAARPNCQAHLVLAKMAVLDKQPETAAAETEAALAHSPPRSGIRWQAHMGLVAARVELARQSTAVAALAAAPAALATRARRDWEAALQTCARADAATQGWPCLDASKRAATIHYNTAVIEENLGVDPYDNLTAAANLRPDYVPAMLHLAEACVKRDDAAQARALLRRVLELQPGNASATRMAYAMGLCTRDAARRSAPFSFVGEDMQTQLEDMQTQLRAKQKPSHTCDCCGARDARKHCARCNSVHYCNLRCQRQHWHASHKRCCTKKE